MSEGLERPSVVDIGAILAPIPGEAPSGENLRYSGVYDEISEARRADDTLAQGDWQTEVKTSDYRRVMEIAVDALSTRSKDLQIAAWLTEALIHQHGLAGLRDGFKILSGLQRDFWETLHPVIEDGDMDGRANAITWLDTQATLATRKAPVTGPSDPRSVIDFEDSKRFDIPANIESLDSIEQQKFNELKNQAIAENRTTSDMWARAKAGTRRVDSEEIELLVRECSAEFTELDRVIEEKYDRNQMPGLSNLKKAIFDIHDLAKKILEEKIAEEPRDEDADETAEGTDGGETAEGAASGKAGVRTGAIQSRADALKRLGDVADYFQRNEPHSPVAYLVQRSVKWGNMPLESWLQDVIKDESVLFQLRQTLGFNTKTGDGTDA